MKKFLAILCAMVLLLATMATALANPSISDLSTTAAEAEGLAEGTSIAVTEAKAEEYTGAVADIVKNVNEGDEPYTVEQALTDLDKTDVLADAASYDFVTNFAELTLSQGDEVVVDEEGNIAVKVTLTIDALKGVAEADLANYKLLVVNPTTSDVAVLDLTAVDLAAGQVSAEFPFLGVFALIQK